VNDPDGRLRRVTYTADSINGFQVSSDLAQYILFKPVL